MAIMGAVVREVVTSTVLANAHSGAAGVSSPASFAKAGASLVGRSGCTREFNYGNALLRRRPAQFVNRTETKGLVSARFPVFPKLRTQAPFNLFSLIFLSGLIVVSIELYRIETWHGI